MDYDDLVARLRGGCDANTAFLLCYEAADVITGLRERVGELARTLNDHLLSEAAETMRANKAQAELANLQVAFNDWKVFHSTARLEADLAAARALRDEAIARVRDMYAGDDGQAWKEARKFLERIDAALAGEKK